MSELLKVTDKKALASINQGGKLSGYIIKRGDSYQVIADGRARNLSIEDFRALMGYCDAPRM